MDDVEVRWFCSGLLCTAPVIGEIEYYFEDEDGETVTDSAPVCEFHKEQVLKDSVNGWFVVDKPEA